MCSLLQELRKTLSVVKIEKEDIETALSDSRKELEALEQKNKVSYSQTRSCVYFINGLMNSFMDIDFILRFNSPLLK